MTLTMPVLFALATAWSLTFAPDQQVSAASEGVTVMLVRQTGELPRRGFVFSVHPDGLPEMAKQFTIANETSSIEALRVHPGPTIAVIGITPEHTRTLAIIDATSGVSLFDCRCRELRLTPDRSRYLCTDTTGKMRSYVIAARQVRDAFPPVAGALQILTSGSLRARVGLLQALPKSPQLSTSPEVRAAVAAELRREVMRDMQSAAAAPLKEGIRTGSSQRDYLGLVISTVAQFRDPSALDTLCRADHLGAVGARAMYGASAIPHIVQALQTPTPAGYSLYYRSGLLESLVLIFRRFSDITERQRSSVIVVARASLDQPASSRELLRTLDLVEELDDDALDGKAEALALDVDVIRRRGITSPAQVQEVQTKAQALRARRLVLP